MTGEEVSELGKQQTDLPVVKNIPLTVVAEDGEGISGPCFVDRMEDNCHLINGEKLVLEADEATLVQRDLPIAVLPRHGDATIWMMCVAIVLDHPRVRETNSSQAFNLGERSDAESLGSVVVCLKGSFVHHVGDGGVIVVD